jgi:hypothetical protein
MVRVSAVLLISSAGAVTVPACGNASDRSASHLPPGGSDPDGGSVDANMPDRVERAPPVDAGPCIPEGTWRIDYDCAVESDLVFVTIGQQGGHRVRFVGRRPPHPITPDFNGRAYFATAAFDAATCTLSLESHIRWIDSGMGFCGDQRRITLVLGTSGEGTLLRYACGDYSGTCTASAERLAAPGDCPEAASGNEPCNTGATCDSGCGSPCSCESGLWHCEYPKLGAACLGDEACSIRRSPLGGFDALACTDGSGAKFLNGSLRDGGDVCTELVPETGAPCAWTGLSCDRCECAADDGGTSAWRCF